MRKLLSAVMALIMIMSFAAQALAVSIVSIPITDSGFSSNAAQNNYEYIRVMLSSSGNKKQKLTLSGSFKVVETGKLLKDCDATMTVNDSKVTITSGDYEATDSIITLERYGSENSESEHYKHYIMIGKRMYLGDMKFNVSAGTLRIINEVPLNEYLYGVVGYEMSESYQLEALKAQAVCAKNYVMMSIAKHGDYDIGDTASEQVYKGYNPEFVKVKEAVDYTLSIAVTYRGRLFQALFADSNGGAMILPSHAWAGSTMDGPYATGPDEYDFKSEIAKKYTLFIPTNGYKSDNEEFNNYVLSKAKEQISQNVEDIKITYVKMINPRHEGISRDYEDMLLTVDATLNDGSVINNATIDIFLYDMRNNSAVLPLPKRRAFWGRYVLGGFELYYVRWGHGVGLSQSGAQQMALEGWDFRQILEFYFPNADVSHIDIATGEISPYIDYTNIAGDFIHASVIKKSDLYEMKAGVLKQVFALEEGTEVQVVNITDSIALIIYNGRRYFINADSLWYNIEYDLKPIEVYCSGSIVSNTPFRTGIYSTSFTMMNLHENTYLNIWCRVGDHYYVDIDGQFGFVLCDDVMLNRATVGEKMSMIGSVSLARGYANGSVNVRTGPTTNYEKITTLRYGDTFDILRITDGWFRIKLEDGQYGYISAKYVKVIYSVTNGGMSNIVENTEPIGTVTLKSRTNVYARTNAMSMLVGTADVGTKLTVYSKLGDWYEIEYFGIRGYVCDADKNISFSENVVEIINRADDETENEDSGLTISPFKVTIPDDEKKLNPIITRRASD